MIPKRNPAKSKMKFWTTVSAMFVLYCGGPYGIEEVVAQSGPTIAIFGLLFMAIFWGIPGVWPHNCHFWTAVHGYFLGHSRCIAKQ